jgi:ATP-binding cassette subfamily B multidrug efflux pump
LARKDFYSDEEEQNPKIYDISLMKRLLSYARRYWLLFAVALVMLLGSSASQLIRPYLVKVAIDDYLNGYTKPMVSYTQSTDDKEIMFEGTYYLRVDTIPSDIPQDRIFFIIIFDGEPYLVNGPAEHSSGIEAEIAPSDNENGLFNYIFTQDGRSYPARKLTPSEINVFRSGDMDAAASIGLIFIIIILAGFAFNFLEVYLLSYAGQNIICVIRQEIFEHLQKMSMSFFDNTPVGRLVTRVSNDTEALNEMYTNVIINLIRDVFIILGVMVIMLRMDLTLFFIAIAALPLILLLTILFRLKIRPVYRKARENLARINSALSENLTGIRIIQIFNREKENYKEFEKINRVFM